MHELDEEAQGKIAQMLYDQQQKRIGKPTSEQQVRFVYYSKHLIYLFSCQQKVVAWAGGTAVCERIFGFRSAQCCL